MAWALLCVSVGESGDTDQGGVGRKAGQWVAGVCFLSLIVCKMVVGKRYRDSFSLVSDGRTALVREGRGDVSMATTRSSLTTQKENQNLTQNQNPVSS